MLEFSSTSWNTNSGHYMHLKTLPIWLKWCKSLQPQLIKCRKRKCAAGHMLHWHYILWHVFLNQTSNKFSKRWSAHHSNWNKQDCKTDSDKDQMTLSRHYSENHGTINKPPLHEAYTVTFVEQPSCHSLDICENKWYHLIDAQINIQNMILVDLRVN